jgi:hypothetical protein
MLAPARIALRRPHTLVLTTLVILGVPASMQTPIEIYPAVRTARR